MRIAILIVLAAFALGAAASADPHVDLTVTSSKAWMVADGSDSAAITATVLRGTGEHAGEPLEGANVSFTVNTPYQLKTYFLLTDKKGVASTTLLSTRVRGNATITVNAWAMIETETWGYLNYSSTVVLNQPIDHGTPASLSTSFKSQAQVRTPVRISVLMKDALGNPIDNRNIVETVQFDASTKDSCGFLSGGSWVKSLVVPVNGSGYANVEYLVDPIGTNYIALTPPSPLKQRLISLEGISQSTPFSVTSVVSPPGSPNPYTVIKTGTFTIGFTFYDQYGYPTMNQPVNVTTSVPGESMTYVTNKYGMAVVTYGPKDTAGIYTVTAMAANNRSVSVSQKVEFVSGEPVDALLTVSPQTMASRDVADDITSDLTMRVMDIKGNPVQGETVTFRFTSSSAGSGFNETQPPALESGGQIADAVGESVTATSDENGEAIVKFHPGAFTTDIFAPGYSSQAQGSAIVEARWSGVARQVTLRYVNYPYLTIESWVNPTTVRVNETVDVTVKVSGDGWALQPKPIKVMLVTDRSGSMLYDSPDRAYSVMQAAKQFVDQMSPSRDLVGLVSFGWNGSISKPGVNSATDDEMDDDYIYPRSYGSYATLDAYLGTPFPMVKNSIDQMVPDGGTPTRLALRVAIDELAGHTNAKDPSVKAIILLSDGEYNWYGDPLGGKTSGNQGTKAVTSYSNLDKNYRTFSGVPSQNMSEYAKKYNITIYTIGFASDISAGCQASLTQIANGTAGGRYYPATSANIGDIYTQIAGALKDTAGVNTTMNLAFKNVVVNNATVPGDQVYSYTYINGRSTLVDTWDKDGVHSPGYPVTRDSTEQWNTDRNLSFFIGTVHLGQTWQSTLTLKILKDGNINVFDQNSKITIQDSPFPMKIPDVYITAVQNNSATPVLGAAHLEIKSLTVTNQGSKTHADLKWDIGYNGKYSISENVMIAPYGTEDWIRLPTKQVANTTTSDTATLDIDTLKDGYYTIRVDGEAYDSNDASDSINVLLSEASGITVLTITPTPTTPPQKSYIKLS